MSHIERSQWKHYIHRLEGAYAPNTIKAYYADITHFVDWCEGSNLTALPTSCSVIQRYLEGGPSTVRTDNYQAASLRCPQNQYADGV